MTDEEFDILRREDTRAVIAENIEADPLKLAFKVSDPIIATQVKVLQRCRKKLPRLYEVRAIVPTISYEQCSSEATAAAKFEGVSGGVCVDLTCGLGVDSMALAARFERVVSIERDLTLSRIVRYNASLLGIDNWEVICGSAEEFVRSYNGPKIDLIYIDPARRSGDGSNRRVFLLEDCSPDVVQMMGRLKGMASRIMIKLSPMFDLEEVFRIFGGSSVRVISVNGECKEVVVDIFEGTVGGTVSVTALRSDRVFRLNFGAEAEPRAVQTVDISECRFLLIADAALYKCRCTERYFTDYMADMQIFVSSYGYSVDRPTEFCGRVFEIVEMIPYQPKIIRAKLGKIKRVNILHRDFPHSTAEICKALGVAEGGDKYMAFTTVNGQRMAIFINAI